MDVPIHLPYTSGQPLRYYCHFDYSTGSSVPRLLFLSHDYRVAKGCVKALGENAAIGQSGNLPRAEGGQRPASVLHCRHSKRENRHGCRWCRHHRRCCCRPATACRCSYLVTGAKKHSTHIRVIYVVLSLMHKNHSGRNQASGKTRTEIQYENCGNKNGVL